MRLAFGVLGMMIMVSSTHFVTIFIGLEVMSIAIRPLRLLSGNPGRRRPRSNTSSWGLLPPPSAYGTR
jgi:NADH:ubiquinone oxidoreductase subunit 2 (subunit N)